VELELKTQWSSELLKSSYRVAFSVLLDTSSVALAISIYQHRHF